MGKSLKVENLQVNYEELKKASFVLRALNHKTRQDILNLIHKNKEMTVTSIYNNLKIEQSRASSFLAILRKAGLVGTRRLGQSVYYFINYDTISIVETGAKIISSKLK